MTAKPNLGSVNQTSQSSFDSNHALYDKVRPGYEPATVEIVKRFVPLAEPGHLPGKVLEVAAGTGKFTSALLTLIDVSQLTVAEPSTGMLETFRENFPQVKAVQAAADELPFADGEFATIYIAQAFHWFSNRASLAELRRVLQPGGSLVLVWNFEDDDRMEPGGWQQRATELVHSLDGGVPQYRDGGWEKALNGSTDLFSHYELERVHFDKPVPSAEFFWHYWASRSYVTALSEAERAKLHDQFMEIMSTAPGKLVAKAGTDIVWVTAK